MKQTHLPGERVQLKWFLIAPAMNQVVFTTARWVLLREGLVHKPIVTITSILRRP